MTRMIVDTETNEILGELEQGDRIIKKKSVEYLGSTDVVETRPKDPFIKLYYNINKVLMGEFSSISDYVLFHTLIHFVRYDSCKLAYDNGVELKLKNIIEESGLPSSTCRRAVDKFVDKGLLYKERTTYYCNPYVFCKGNRVYRSTLEKFNSTKYKKFNRSIRGVGEDND